jgi:anti-sigma regulatory factor (Ser/Thr protein kinase)
MSPTASRRRAMPSIRRPLHDRQYVKESYPAVVASVPVARADVVEFAAAAGIAGEQLDAVRLAVSEAITNVVVYAYPARLGHIHVTARVASGELWVLVADSGCGIHAGRDSDGLGLGLALISQLTDGFSVLERSSGGTELRLRFVIQAPEPGRQAPERGRQAPERGRQAPEPGRQAPEPGRR